MRRIGTVGKEYPRDDHRGEQARDSPMATSLPHPDTPVPKFTDGSHECGSAMKPVSVLIRARVITSEESRRSPR